MISPRISILNKLSPDPTETNTTLLSSTIGSVLAWHFTWFRNQRILNKNGETQAVNQLVKGFTVCTLDVWYRVTAGGHGLANEVKTTLKVVQRSTIGKVVYRQV